MMKLIIDSGATKSEYIILREKDVVFRYKNDGININYLSDEEVSSIFQDFANQLSPETFNPISQIDYYGAGCMNPGNAIRVTTSLTNIFNDKKINVHSDLLAACHALCHSRPGWVAILGTGSASCLYDGSEITDMPPSLGFMLGDEGGGTHIGKSFLIHYLYKKLPDEIATLFENETGANREMVMRKIYREANPNRYMASVAVFVGKHQEKACLNKICFDSFTNFFRNQLFHFDGNNNLEEVNIIGSVGFYFQEIVKNAAEKLNIRIAKVLAAPGDELINYHINKS